MANRKGPIKQNPDSVERRMAQMKGELTGEDGSALAWRRVAGEGPTVVWLGGFHSDMAGTKASLLADWAEAAGRDFLRFDYSGHGESAGAFEDGTIGRWRDDSLRMIDGLLDGPAVLVGSSMGGWMACLAALARPEKVAALVLIAPAADFTDKLMWPAFSEDIRATIVRDGRWFRPSPYADGGYAITRGLIEDGARWNIMDGPVGIGCPVRILQGGRDPDVPAEHARRLFDLIVSDDKRFELIEDADHSMSRPGDMARIIAAIEAVSGQA